MLRLLDRTRSLYRLSDLGMPAEAGALYSSIVSSPFGMVIVGGPTGSGKTTTLYATLSEINRTDINVMTIEDPVEYIFPRINQIQISDQAGLTFATGLKSILRQDPDVILVGEVRDVETAAHRGAVGADRSPRVLLGARHRRGLVAVPPARHGHRAVPRHLRDHRRGRATARAPHLQVVRGRLRAHAVGADDLPEARRRRTRTSGCGARAASSARGTGYFDRVGVYEVLAITDEIRQCVVDGKTPREARELAIQQGLRTLQHEAIQLVQANVTTMEEVVKHVLVNEGLE